MKNSFILIGLLFVTNVLLGQETTKEQIEVAFAVIEKVPVYPGCKDDTNE